jgi:hypothetical protein
MRREGVRLTSCFSFLSNTLWAMISPEDIIVAATHDLVKTAVNPTRTEPPESAGSNTYMQREEEQLAYKVAVRGEHCTAAKPFVYTTKKGIGGARTGSDEPCKGEGGEDGRGRKEKTERHRESKVVWSFFARVILRFAGICSQ